MKNLSQLSQLANVAMRKGDADTVLVLNLSEVLTKPQVRKHFSGIEELGENIKTDGQHHPIVVFPKNKDGKYVIQKGERRYRACKSAGLKTIKAIVNTAILDKLDEVAGELGENIHRADLTSFEIADALHQFIQLDWSQSDICRRINKSRAYVSLHLSLKRLPEQIRALLPTEVTNDTTTLNMVAQIHEIDPKACLELCEKAKQDGSLSRSTARKALDGLRAAAQEPADGANAAQPTLPPSQDEKSASAPVLGDPAGTGSPNEDEQKLAVQAASKAQAEKDESPGTTVATKRDDSHKQPGTVKKVPIEQPPEGSTFVFVSPAHLKVVCNFKLHGVERSGELCLNRVDQQPGLLWVKLYTDEGKPDSAEAEYVSVQADKVKIKALSQHEDERSKT